MDRTKPENNLVVRTLALGVGTICSVVGGFGYLVAGVFQNPAAADRDNDQIYEPADEMFAYAKKCFAIVGNKESFLA